MNQSAISTFIQRSKHRRDCRSALPPSERSITRNYRSAFRPANKTPLVTAVDTSPRECITRESVRNIYLHSKIKAPSRLSIDTLRPAIKDQNATRNWRLGHSSPCEQSITRDYRSAPSAQRSKIKTPLATGGWGTLRPASKASLATIGQHHPPSDQRSKRHSQLAVGALFALRSKHHS